jgi:hypothetical protein
MNSRRSEFLGHHCLFHRTKSYLLFRIYELKWEYEATALLSRQAANKD